MEFKRSFSLFEAYDFLEANGLSKECEEIRSSPDKYLSYSSTLRRAKIIALTKDKKLLDNFCQSVWPSGLTEKGIARIKFFENLILRFNSEMEGTSSEEDEEDSTLEENSFAYENDLRNFLVKNLSIIEKGLKVYNENGISGAEYVIPDTSRRIDILAVDSKNTFVVIELKVSRGHEKVVGQALFYQSSIKTIFKQQLVRVIIIAKEISPELKTATQFLHDFELFEYQLSMTLNKIK